MSGPALKWAMQPDREQPDRPAMSPEKRLLLVALAYEADRFNDTIRKDIATIAKDYGIGRQSALRYVGEFMEDGPLRDTGERAGRTNRITILQFVTEWSPDAVSRRRTKSQSNSTSTRTIRRGSNSTPADTIQEVCDAENAVRMVRVDASNGTCTHQEIVRVDASNSTCTRTIQAPPLYNGLQELPINPQESLNAHRREPSPLSRTDDSPATGPEVIAKAMVDTFFAHGEAKVRSDVEDGCLRFVEQGASVADLHEAITRARGQQKDGRRPGWAAVSKALAGMLETRASVITGAHASSKEAQDAARRLEAIFVRYLDKPPATSISSRYRMGEWLGQCVTWRKVDEATFEAACRDVKNRDYGKPRTWRNVKAMLDARIGTRGRDEPQTTEAKDFFDQPASAAGTFNAPGNFTLH